AGEEEPTSIPILEIPAGVEEKQRARTAALRHSRDSAAAAGALGELKRAATEGTNLMPRLLECTRAYVTLGEMCTELAGVFGVHQEAPVF
ncbi:MAG TPA: methylmalonyl-CoA mutase family protein, partial [Bacteroidota bacterium]|nr:methylmalonyl-CoA mutase family protein [Bacteroidota bacterium]